MRRNGRKHDSFLGIDDSALPGRCWARHVYFFLKDKLNELLQKGLLGFASGVMVAASVWSLLIPSMDMAAGMGRLAFVPAASWHAFRHGMFLLGMDRVIPHLHLGTQEAEGPKTSLKRRRCLSLR